MAITWPRHLKRVFSINISKCEKCKGPVWKRKRRLPPARWVNSGQFRASRGCIRHLALVHRQSARGPGRALRRRVIGHASGIVNPGVGSPAESLKQYASPMEEGRADLVALYYMMDPILIEIGVMPSLDVGLAEYDGYIRNGLMTQLYRIEPGKQIEEAHMRNRQEIAAWVYEKGQPENVIERIVRDGKTYFRINDYQRLRELFGDLLQEHQRIKSEGDFAAAQNLQRFARRSATRMSPRSPQGRAPGVSGKALPASGLHPHLS